MDRYKATLIYGVDVQVSREEEKVQFTLQTQVGKPFISKDLIETPGLFSLTDKALEEIGFSLCCPYKECTSNRKDDCKACVLGSHFVVLPDSQHIEKLSELVRE